MTDKLNEYPLAATRANIRRSYQAVVRHFEAEWGGFLPASTDQVARHLAAHAETLAANTLKQRLAALAQWHVEQGFPDPAKAPVVRKTFKGCRTSISTCWDAIRSLCQMRDVRRTPTAEKS